MYQPIVCAKKFALYLYDNNHLNNFIIEKQTARHLFNDEFKKGNNVAFNFGTIFYHTIGFLQRQKDLNLMVYKQNKLINLKKKEAEIEAAFNKIRRVKKKVFVDHSLSFTSREQNDKNKISKKECEMCNVQLKNEQDYQNHLKDTRHSFIKEFSTALRQPNRQVDLEFTVAGLPVRDNIILRKGVPKSMQLQIKNLTKQSIKIVSVECKSTFKEIEFKQYYPVDILPLTSIQYVLNVCSTNEGIIYFPILFTTESNNNTQSYSIEMVFHTHDEFFDDLHPVEPYVRTSKAVLKEFIENVDNGERPNIFTQIPNKVPLKPYLLPVDVSVVLNSGLKPFDGMTDSQQAQLASIKDLLNVQDKKNCLTRENYTKLLDLLLFIEEHQMYKDIRDYDLPDHVLTRLPNGFFELKVPGLAEHRPSVIFADSVFLREHKNSSTLYQGFVHQVKESSVVLKFSLKFTKSVFIAKKKFYVNFAFNRYPLKVEHQAVEFTKKDNISHLLFPNKVPQKSVYSSSITWINPDISNNFAQQQAVRAILNRTAMPSPYLIFGPPGTGKTMTVVESVKQIHKLTNYNVLICTPSNNAANEITRRLNDLPTTDLLRYIAPSFAFNLIPQEIKKFINYHGDNYYGLTIEDILRYRIVIVTLCSAAKLVNAGCPPNHFAYVFVDESGQATETETLIPIAHILSGGSKTGEIFGQIVLAGDPMQLGPVIHSPLALEYGFGISMLERLMTHSEIYKKDTSNKYNPSVLTKLLKNYRSNPVIINRSNNLFYDNELQVAGDHMINVALNWECLPNPKFPMIFHSVIGIDQREANSPSFFNVQEIQVIMSYLDKLIGQKMSGIAIHESHIGIVSPYKKQVDKIKQACKKKRYHDNLMIGSVEQIQGQERLIIIISTVRSKPDFLKFDNKHHLGFLQNPKRFNVAVTRAKALLIVIGNPNILQYDKNWFSLISYCKDNKSLVGDKFDFTKDETVETLIKEIDNSKSNSEDGPSFMRGDV